MRFLGRNSRLDPKDEAALAALDKYILQHRCTTRYRHAHEIAAQIGVEWTPSVEGQWNSRYTQCADCGTWLHRKRDICLRCESKEVATAAPSER